MRWLPMKFNGGAMFHQSIKTMMGAGSPDLKTGLAIHHFSMGKGMASNKVAMYSSDGDMLIVPQAGVMLVTTEFGKLRIEPKEIVVVPRGVKFSIDVEDGPSRGWIAECF